MKKFLSMTLALIMILTAIMTMAPLSVLAEGDGAPASATPITPDTTWYDASKSSFDISTAAQWLGLAQLVAAETTAGEVTSGKTFNLKADIDLNPGWDASVTVEDREGVLYAVIPDAPVNVGGHINTFKGTLNGNG